MSDAGFWHTFTGGGNTAYRKDYPEHGGRSALVTDSTGEDTEFSEGVLVGVYFDLDDGCSRWDTQDFEAGELEAALRWADERAASKKALPTA